MIFFQNFVSLVGSFISGMGTIVIMCIAAGLLFACPYIIRSVIDRV